MFNKDVRIIFSARIFQLTLKEWGKSNVKKRRVSNTSWEKQGADANGGNQTSREEEKNQQSGSSKDADSLFGKFKSTISSPNVSAAFQKLKDAKLVDITKKGYDIVKEELSSTPTKRKRVPFASSGETSTRTDLVVMPSKQSWCKSLAIFFK